MLVEDSYIWCQDRYHVVRCECGWHLRLSVRLCGWVDFFIYFYFEHALRLEIMKGTLGGFDVLFFVLDTRAGVEPGLLG